KRVNNEELKKLQARRGEMEKELDELNQEIFHLEGDCNTKEASLKRLHFQYDQSKAQTERQLDVSRERKQRIEALTAQIEEEKLKRKRERNAFEQQLEELINKHKWMAEFYGRGDPHQTSAVLPFLIALTSCLLQAARFQPPRAGPVADQPERGHRVVSHPAMSSCRGRFLKDRKVIVQGGDGDADDREKEAWQP
ncbi:hypothetical protein chiPu_0021515, partial [Chiloscyllium punctatum]|nr:hypothetical protein [Chiloscyllium punctatum]